MQAGKYQRGVALITALIITAIAVVLASAMIWQVHLSQRRSANILFFDQGWQYLRGAEDWATWILQRDVENSNFDSLTEAWTTPLAGLAIEGGQLGGQITDLQGRFNLNNLRFTQPNNQLYKQQFNNLLTALGITAPITDAIIDWVDANSEQAGAGGAEDSYYLGLTPAYRTANAPFESISELRLVKGVTPEIFSTLAPHVTVLPAEANATGININTATPPVVASLLEPPSPRTVQTILELRPFKSPQALSSAAKPGEFLIPPGVESHYFLLHTQANIGSLRISMYSLLHRDGSGSTQAIERSLGTL